MEIKNLKISKCKPEHWNSIRRLRNELSFGFVETSYINPKTHNDFMATHHKGYVVAEVDKKVIGFAGVVNNDIRVAVHYDYQGLGVGKQLIETIHELFPKAVAKVRIDNAASLALFKSCGFKEKFYILEK